MSERPIFNAELGRYFRALREQAKLGQRQAAALLQHRGRAGKSYSALQLLEAGRVKHPEREYVEALALLYRQSPEAVWGHVMRVLYGTSDDSLRHKRAEETSGENFRGVNSPDRVVRGNKSLPRKGALRNAEQASHVTDRQAELEFQIDTAHAILGVIKGLASQIGLVLDDAINGRDVEALAALEPLRRVVGGPVDPPHVPKSQSRRKR